MLVEKLKGFFLVLLLALSLGFINSGCASLLAVPGMTTAIPMAVGSVAQKKFMDKGTEGARCLKVETKEMNRLKKDVKKILKKYYFQTTKEAPAEIEVRRDKTYKVKFTKEVYGVKVEVIQGGLGVYCPLYGAVTRDEEKVVSILAQELKKKYKIIP